jgi:hypothetical protein
MRCARRSRPPQAGDDDPVARAEVALEPSQSRSGSDYRRPLVFNIILTDTNLRKKDASIIRRMAFDMRLSDPTK